MSGRVLLGAGVLVHLGMLLSLQWGFLNPLFDDAVHRAGQGADFYSVAQAGRNLLDGVSIYSVKPVQQVVPFFNPYRYHPFVACTIGLGSALLRSDISYVLWILLLEGMLLINLLVTRSLFSEERSAVAMGMWLLFSPYYLELYMGQFSFLMASLMFWALVAWLRGKDRSGDWWWMTSLVVKSNSALFAPVLLKTGRWKSVLLAAVVSLVLAAPYFLLVEGSASAFSRNISEGLQAQTIFGNQGFAAFLAVVLLKTGGLWSDFAQEFALRLDQMNHMVEIPLMIWTVLIVGTALLVTWRSSSDSGIGLLLLWIVAYFLFYKHVWEHQYVMMLPVFILLYHQMVTKRMALSGKLFWGVFAVIAAPTAFVFIDRSPVLFDPELPWSLAESVLYHGPKPLATLVLFLAVITGILSGKTQGAPVQQGAL